MENNFRPSHAEQCLRMDAKKSSFVLFFFFLNKRTEMGWESDPAMRPLTFRGRQFMNLRIFSKSIKINKSLNSL